MIHASKWALLVSVSSSRSEDTSSIQAANLKFFSNTTVALDEKTKIDEKVDQGWPIFFQKAY